jgi:hypothetical protein
MVTYIHWLTPTKAVRIRNHGDTIAARSALRSVTVPAIAKRTRSSGQEERGVVDVFIPSCLPDTHEGMRISGHVHF